MLVYKSEVGVIKGTGTRSPGSTLFLIYPLLRFIASNKEGRAFSVAEGFLNMDFFNHTYNYPRRAHNVVVFRVLATLGSIAGPDMASSPKERLYDKNT